MRLINLFVGMLLVVIAISAGCLGYGEIGETAYKHASALYSICNLKSEERLGAFKETLSDVQEISANEKKWLLDIVELAENGNWENANRLARQMLDEQVSKR